MAIQFPQKTLVVAHEQFGTAGRSLHLDSRFDFVPGQLVSLSLTLAGPSRLYSICSAPGEPSLEIIYNLVEDGSLTPELWNLRPGDSVFLQGPRGGFIEPAELAQAQRMWWICNGTGISPFISMLRNFQAQSSRLIQKRYLIFGCRTPSDAWFLQDLKSAAQNQGLTCIICLSSPTAKQLVSQHELAASIPHCPNNVAALDGGGIFLHFGRLTAWAGLRHIPTNDLAMLCGSSLMISEVRDLLLARPLSPAQIFAETYF